MPITSNVLLRDEDGFRIVRANESQVVDTLLLLSFSPMLNSYVEKFRSGAVPATAELARVRDVLARLIHFCVPSAAEHSDPLSIAGDPSRSRQQQLRHQGYLELLVDIIRAPFGDW